MRTIPGLDKIAFSCPHCNVFTTHEWHQFYLNKVERDERTPFIPQESDYRNIENDLDMPLDMKVSIKARWDEVRSGELIRETSYEGVYSKDWLNNLFATQCFNCSKLSIWKHSVIIYPAINVGPLPNQDLPADIKSDFEEARSIASLSPRGSAALLRLCVQKLCKHLGECGKNIDEDISSLVSKGLNPLIQKSLDYVRVIGNEAVHPGSIELRDNRDVAEKLLHIVNSIADQMITHPKVVQDLYDSLPQSKLAAIERRDSQNKLIN